jgi:hypothetical protein
MKDPRRARVKTAVASPGLEKHAAGARAEELVRERARLLGEVQKKQRQLEQIKARANAVAEEAVARAAPLVARQRALVAELEALFRELLHAERLSVRAKKELGRLRRQLELQGVLEPALEAEDQDAPSASGAAEPPNAWDAPPRHSAKQSERPHPGRPEVSGASQAGQERRSLREIFRNLARAVHPDQARQDGERERRTEVMKQVTRAYEDGDLARLIELESVWQSERALLDGDPEQRCRALTRLNRELLDQLREVTRQLREAKRDLRDATESHPSAELIELATAELDDVQALCEVLRRFREGKLSLKDMMQGPLPRPRRRRRRA